MLVRSLLRRLIGAIATLLAVSLLVFVALNTIPGDAAQAIAGDSASQSQIESLRSQMGLDLPLPARYLSFLGDLLLRGDAGTSLANGQPVLGLVASRLPYTVALAVSAIGLSALAGGLVGTLAASRAGTAIDTLLMGTAALGLAVPTFWAGLLAIMLFALKLHWLPVVGADTPRHLVLPALTLGAPTAAIVARLVRSSVLDVLRSDFVRTAHAKGVPAHRVMHVHVLRNSLIPVATVLGLHTGQLLGGAFVVETIFGWPGLGRLTVQAIFDRDYPVVLGTTLAIAAMYQVVLLALDLLHGVLDPRVAGGAV